MNIIDALKSRHPIKRSGWSAFVNPYVVGKYHFERDDILADDWEIQEPSVTITASQFWEAGNAVIANYMEAPKVYVQDAMNLLARRLGLGSKP